MTTQTSATPTLHRATLDITGMTCAACVRRLERALLAVEGVSEASVNLATQRAQASFDPGRASQADLEAAVVAAGYGVVAPAPAEAAPGGARGEQEGRERRALVADLLLAAGATVPLLVLGMSHGAIPFAETFAGRVLAFALATLVVFGPGRRFLRVGYQALRHRSPDMNTLVSLGALAAWSWSTVATFAPHWFAHEGHAAPHLAFEAAGAILTFVLLGKFLESNARWRLGDAVRALHALVPHVARRLAVEGNGRETEVPVAELQVGDRVRVRPGERVPVDGVVVDGAAALDESLLTGESVPVDKREGDSVVGGSMNTTGTLVVRVVRTGRESAVARVAAAVEEAQGSKAPIARFADRASAVFVPIVLALAAVTFACWWLLVPNAAGFATAVEHAVAVLVIACPCALGLATPAAVAVGAGRGAELGVLFRNGAALEVASHVDAVYLDKTGTLTNGRPELVAVETLGELDGDAVVRLAAAAEVGSEHPFAKAIVAAAGKRGLVPPAARDFVATPAMGVQATVEGNAIAVGKPEWLAARGVDLTAAAASVAGLAARGVTPLAVARDVEVLAVLGLSDELRPESRAAVANLHAMGLQVAILSGDRRGVAEAVAKAVGVETVAAELLPEDKAARIAAARSSGLRVAMVGDGVNDAHALAAADLGMAVGSGTDVAAAAADVVLLRGGLAGVSAALVLARATMRAIRRNLVWASIYNLLGIPIAAGALAGLGLSMSPVYASAAMSLSSVSVLLSSLWLRRFRAETVAEARG